jgi:hypothetical protein
VVDGGAAAAHDRAERHVLPDVHTVEARHVVRPPARAGHDQRPYTVVEHEPGRLLEDVVGADGAIGSQRHQHRCGTAVEEHSSRLIEATLGRSIPGNE